MDLVHESMELFQWTPVTCLSQHCHQIPADRHHLIPQSVLVVADSINASLRETSRTPPRTSTVVRISNLDDYSTISQNQQEQQILQIDVQEECSKYGHH